MSDIEKKVELIAQEVMDSVLKIESEKDLEELRVNTLGKKGSISLLMRELSNIDKSDRAKAGLTLNKAKQELSQVIRDRENFLLNKTLEKKISEEKLDITLPVRPKKNGSIHPINHTINEISTIMNKIGFTIETGPDVEDDFHNFEALNIPSDHPARQDHDTFYMKQKDKQGTRKVLRTHTSPVQVRTMETQSPPLYIIAPGRTFRRDDDSTHSPMFHQIEALAIDRNLTMGHLKSVIEYLIESYFGISNLPIRFRPSFFPFTEPSAEVDISCKRVGEKIEIGGSGEWLEVMGCGMVNPKVLRNCGIEPAVWQGFAFGLGVERFAMLKYGIADLRNFYEGDIRWLEHYSFSPSDVLKSSI